LVFDTLGTTGELNGVTVKFYYLLYFSVNGPVNTIKSSTAVFHQITYLVIVIIQRILIININAVIASRQQDTSLKAHATRKGARQEDSGHRRNHL
jgi:hypothetical protein